ncbi:MAG: hypothetical protein FWD78_07730 [Treponema sp.]|nr:hypothetical protein [Treponema sp.]
MVEHVLIDSLNLKAAELAARWKNQVRKAVQLKHYNTLDDDSLIRADTAIYKLLSRIFDRGMDRSLMGSFFVSLGKSRMQEGFPISEMIYAINLTERVIIEYIVTEYAPDSPGRMYQSMGVISDISEFFLLGCFYMTKGFLEAVYTKMNINDKVSEELLKKYFKDDFFFKKEE